MILLVLEAAHEAAAHARNLGGIEGEILLLGHLDGHGLEIAHELRAAHGTAAQAQAAHHLGLVAHADLLELNAGLEHGRQILDQGSEIHAAVGREIEQNLAAVKGVFHAHQLHFEVMVKNLLLADAVRLFFLAHIIAMTLRVLGGGDADDRLERGDDFVILHLAHARHHLGIFNAAGGLDNHRVARRGPQLAGIKIIQLACVAETHAYNGRHELISSDMI